MEDLNHRKQQILTIKVTVEVGDRSPLESPRRKERESFFFMIGFKCIKRNCQHKPCLQVVERKQVNPLILIYLFAMFRISLDANRMLEVNLESNKYRGKIF